MAYNKRNKLAIILEVQEVYKLHKTEGVSTAFVYRRFIRPRFHISKRTLYTYLETPAAKELKKLEV